MQQDRVGGCRDQIAGEGVTRGRDDAADRGLPDASPRRLDSATERMRVLRVGQESEVGERVPHLGSLVEPERAEDAVRDAGRGERGLDRGGRERRAGEDEDLAGRRAGGERIGDQPTPPSPPRRGRARSRAS